MSLSLSRRVAVLIAVATGVHLLSAVVLRGEVLYSGAVSNVGQALLQVGILILIGMNIPRATRSGKVFWSLMGTGVFIWLLGQCNWIYYENIVRTGVPEPSGLDALIFVHIVPMIAAAAVQPHAEPQSDDVRYRLGALDFSMLLLFWLFLYGYVLYPWQYIVPESKIFGVRFNILYFVENIILVLSFAVLWTRTKHQWRGIYKHLFIASTLYMMSSFLVNVIIDVTNYVSGGFSDVPLTLAMGWFAIAVAKAYESRPEAEPPVIAFQRQTYWHSLLAFAALLTMPLMAIWAYTRIQIFPRVQLFRMLLTLVALIGMLALFFVKQMLLDRRLITLLDESRRAYDEQQALQGHLLHAEKLAAIGRLVAGAAHEINNPLTAIVGYSDLLAANEGLDNQHRDFAEKILQQARRTKTLVQNLLTFAKQTPLERRAVNINAIVGHALQLHELDFAGKNVQIICRMQADLPAVIGDENQLLQVFLHIMNNGVDAMLEHSGGGTLIVSTDVVNGRVQWTCSDTGPGIADPNRIFDPFFTTKPVGKGTGLGLSASYGIIRDHRGDITCQNRPEGGATFMISLPPAEGMPVPAGTAAKSASLQ